VVESWASGDVEGRGAVGGLVGSNRERVEASSASGAVEGNGAVGGLVGSNEKRVVASSASGAVEGNGAVGGLVGFNDNARLEQSFATGQVDGDSPVGGVVGENDGIISATYWNKETTGQAVGIGSGNEGGVTGLDTEQMQGVAAAEHMDALDFGGTWQFVTDLPEYPVLAAVGGVPQPPPVVGENPPQDLDGDGLYEDIRGDGVFDILDAQALFTHLDSDVVQEHSEAFNFRGADPTEVTTVDVQELYKRLN